MNFSNLSINELVAIHRAEWEKKHPKEWKEREIARLEKYKLDHPTFTDEQWLEFGYHIREIIANDSFNNEIYKGLALAAGSIKNTIINNNLRTDTNTTTIRTNITPVQGT